MPDTADDTTTSTAGPSEEADAEAMLAEATTSPTGNDPWSDPETARKEAEKLRREAASWRTKYREAEPLAKRAKEIEDAQKSELERAQEALADAQRTAQTSQAETLRLKVALRHGISDEDAELFLTGQTEEALTRQAERLAALKPAAAATASNGRGPVEALRPGAMPNPPAPSLEDQIAAANKAGNWREVLRLQNQKLANASPQ